MQLFKLSAYILLSICVSFADDCDDYNTSENCPDAYCEWAGSYCDDCAYDGAMKCIRDCAEVCDVYPVTDPVGYCDWFGDLMDNNQTEDGLTGCLADCGTDSDFEIPHLNMTEWVCSDCNAIEDDNCQWISHTVSPPDKRCGEYNTLEECAANSFCEWDNAEEGSCDEADCENGNYDQTECDSYPQCAWDTVDGAGACHFDDPHECLHDCTGYEVPPAAPTPNEHCEWLIDIWDENGCTSDCDFLVNMEYSMCNECYTTNNSDTTGNECDAWFYFDDDYDDGDDGPPECLMTCGQGFDTLSEDSSEEEFCNVLTAANTTGCGCSEEELSDIECFSYMCGGLEYMDMEGVEDPTCMLGCITIECDDDEDECAMLDCWVTSGCMNNCSDAEMLLFDGMAYICDAPDVCKEFFDMDNEHGNYCAQYDEDQAGCEGATDCYWDGMYCNPDYYDDCHQYTSSDECPLDHCWWDDYDGQCVHDYDDGDEGPPECMQDCPGIETLGPDSGIDESCAFFTSISDNSCTDTCGNQEALMFLMMDFMCGIYDDCIDEGNSETECELVFNMDDDDSDDGDEEGEDGPPYCVLDCVGVNEFDPEENPTEFCEWLTALWESDDTDGGDDPCFEDCDSMDQIEIYDKYTMCTECLDAENCDDGLNVDENKLLLPEQFALHPVYPNPFNPTTDIGFSLELAGPVSISVYDVTGRQIETIVNNEFRNAGSHIINWNGSPFPSGIYFIYLQAGKQIAKQKITLLK